MDYTCRRCGHGFTNKSNYLAHLRRKFPCKIVFEDIEPSVIIEELVPKTTGTKHVCDYCQKCFANRQNRWRHMQDCPDKTTNMVMAHDDVVKQLMSKVDELEKYIHSQNTQVGANNIKAKNVNIQQNIQQNIINLSGEKQDPTLLKEFGCENLKAIPDDFVASCFMFLKYRDLLENLHCDPNFPENHNVRIKSVKRNMMEIYKNKQWNVVTLNEGLTELIQQGTRIFQHYARKNEDKIIEEDMSEEELAEIMSKLQELDAMNKKYILPLSKDIQAMLETHKIQNKEIVKT